MSKNIIICCDGTSNDVTCDSTNVLRLYRSLQRNDDQIAYYDSGVGTLADPTKLTSFGKRVSKKLDMAIGHSVRENVCEAYRFLARYYESDDRIFLFGFSRGAYTVRALAGMIHFLGLVHPELDGLARLAWTVYADDDQILPIGKRFESGNRFKKSFSISPPARIHFIGAWDTVSSFGWIWNLKTVPFSANNPSVDHVRHAVSIDEHRACFQPNLFCRNSNTPSKHFKELWFAGAHADVGGGYPEKESGLAKITLKWMYEEAEQLGCLFDESQKAVFLGESVGDVSKPDVRASTHNSTEGFWHALEWVPRKQWDHDSERLRWFWPNRYRRRKIREGSVLHESVQEKLDEDPTYRPRNLPKSYSLGR